MDLIYVDVYGYDKCVIKDYSIDMAIGSNENDFELTLDKNAVNLDVGGMIYFSGTGYGGIIDGVKVKTASATVAYYGRTFEGILENSVIMPPAGAAYYVADGDANSVISGLISAAGLGDLFKTSTANVKNVKYDFRYNGLYEGLNSMLWANGLKLQLSTIYDGGKTKVKIEAVPAVDYTQSEEWNSAQLKLEIDDATNQINHLICLGNGTLQERHVIHLFTDKKGNVQQYVNTANPVKDDDYILDESKKVVTGADELVQVYDYPNIQNRENYVALTTAPADWSNPNLQSNYYVKDGDEYTAIDKLAVINYLELYAQPSDWESNYKNYYYVNNRKFESIPEQDQSNYARLTSRPSNWATNYGSYYEYKSDGTSATYVSVSPDKEEYYEAQTMQPSDWESNYGSYYKADYTAVTLVPLAYETETYYESRKPVYYTGDWYSLLTEQNTDVDITQQYVTPSAVLDNAQYYFKLNGNNVYYTSIKPYITSINGYLPQIVALQAQIVTYKRWLTFNHGVPVFNPDYQTKYDEATALIRSREQKYNAMLGVINTVNSYGLTVFINSSSLEACISQKEYYYMASIYVIPTWQSGTYYTKKSRDVAPSFYAQDYYALTITHDPPAFALGTYYELTTSYKSNTFVSGKYYKLYVDHYTELVAAGIKKLSELRKVKTVKSTLDSTQLYDIGDIVGASESITNTSITSKIIKKILSGDASEIKINYTLGG